MAKGEKKIAPNGRPSTTAFTTQRDEQVKTLMRLEFPYSWAPPPISYLGSSISPSDSNANYRSWQHDESVRKQRSTELMRMDDDKFNGIYAEAWGRVREADRARRTRLTPAASVPDWQFWIREDEWELRDAAVLLAGLEPRQGLGANVRAALQEVSSAAGDATPVPDDLSDEGRTALAKAQEIFRRSLQAQRSRRLTSLEPRIFLAWAAGKDYELPAACAKLLAAEPQVVSVPSTGSTSKATKASAESRRSRNTARNKHIVDLDKAGKSRKEIAKELGGLSSSTIGRVLNDARNGRPRR